MDLQRLLKSRVTMVLLVLFFSAVAFITVELYWQKRDVDQEVDRLSKQADQISKDNTQLSELIKYLGTPEYKEKEAREKLNLKKEGEQVVVLPDPEDENGLVASASTDDQPNPKKWFNYFFKRE